MRGRKSLVSIAFSFAGLFMAASSSLAGERPLMGPAIEHMLSGNTVTGVNDRGAWRQFFNANGETRYVSGNEPPSGGSWKVMGDKYCSQWPPSETWACYDISADQAANPPTITFVGESGTRFPGTVKTGNAL